MKKTVQKTNKNKRKTILHQKAEVKWLRYFMTRNIHETSCLQHELSRNFAVRKFVNHPSQRAVINFLFSFKKSPGNAALLWPV
jgi:hypothetical protein